MGVYLSTPNTEKKSSDETCKQFNYGASSMQGWRMSQEDAHNCIPDFDENTALFAVYDGHGGAEVAQYCATNLPQFIKDTTCYTEGKLSAALEEAYLGFDALLTTPLVVKELKILAGVESDEEETPAKRRSEAELLRQEADMPIEDLMAQYETGESIQPRTRILRKKVQVNSPVIKPKKLPFPNVRDTEIMDSNENANTEEKLDDKITNGHAENENNINLEKESQMSSSLSFVQQDTVSSSADNSSKLSPQITISNSSEGSSSCEQSSSALSCGSSSSNQKDEASSSSVSTDVGGISSSCQASSSSGSSKTTEITDLESSGVSSSDSKQTAQIGSSNEVCQGSHGENMQEDASSSNIAETAGGSSDIKSKEEDEDDYNEEEDEDFSGSDEDVEFDSEDEEEESEDEDETDNLGVEEEQHTEEPGSDSGSTAVVALIRDKQIIVANAGDSRCILSRGGKAVDLSFDHKPEDDMERNRIQAAGGKVTEEGRVNGGLNMSRAIGDHFYKRNTTKSPREQMITALPDIETTTLQENDEFLVLACDGIWNSMTSQEVVDFVREKMKEEENKKQLSSICEQLFDRCLAPNTLGDGTGCDNMTCIIVTFDKLWNNNKNKRQAEGTEDTSDKRRKIEELGT